MKSRLVGVYWNGWDVVILSYPLICSCVTGSGCDRPMVPYIEFGYFFFLSLSLSLSRLNLKALSASGNFVVVILCWRTKQVALEVSHVMSIPVKTLLGPCSRMLTILSLNGHVSNKRDSSLVIYGYQIVVDVLQIDRFTSSQRIWTLILKRPYWQVYFGWILLSLKMVGLQGSMHMISHAG